MKGRNLTNPAEIVSASCEWGAVARSPLLPQMAAIDGGPAQLALLKTELVPAGATLGTV